MGKYGVPRRATRATPDPTVLTLDTWPRRTTLLYLPKYDDVISYVRVHFSLPLSFQPPRYTRAVEVPVFTRFAIQLRIEEIEQPTSGNYKLIN